MPEPTQKESAQSDHPTRRKRRKCAEILGYFDDGPKQQIWTILTLYPSWGDMGKNMSAEKILFQWTFY